MSQYNIATSPKNLVIVDDVNRKKTIGIVEQLLKDEKTVTAFISNENSNLYRKLHESFSGSYASDLNEIVNFDEKFGLLELISSTRFLGAILERKLEFSDLTTISLSRALVSTHSFLVIDENYSDGNKHLKELIAHISKTAAKRGIYTIVVLDSLEEAESFADNAEVIV